MSKAIVMKRLTIDVPVAGQRVQVSATTIITPFVQLHTPSTNGGNIYFGNETVSSAWIPKPANTTWGVSVENGMLYGSGSYIDLSNYYVDASVSGDDLIIEYADGV